MTTVSIPARVHEMKPSDYSLDLVQFLEWSGKINSNSNSNCFYVTTSASAFLSSVKSINPYSLPMDCCKVQTHYYHFVGIFVKADENSYWYPSILIFYIFKSQSPMELMLHFHFHCGPTTLQRQSRCNQSWICTTYLPQFCFIPGSR